MPNVKDLKVRIKSIKSTQKITQAMKMVAASKVRKVQQRVFNSRPYTDKLNSIVERIVCAIPPVDRKEVPLMVERGVKVVCLLVISSDRGLCGSYNTNILKKASRRILELEKEGKQVKLILIGSKANNFFKRTNKEILDSFIQIPAIPTVELANLIASSANNAFVEGKVDIVETIGTSFISMLRSDVYLKHFLPIVPAKEVAIEDPGTTPMEPAVKCESEVLFEPSLSTVLDSLLPLYLSNNIYHSLLEATCSELASRMNAMSNATTNAKELMDLLTIVYNKARQSSITQDILEVVSGAEALK
ncbi:MAG: F0F1 ATP synthase subunit gamma [Candidatus Melainabacteria bacterium]|nr:F0F1 ATP synthase subunit gamma [Candidatus Melainabacteria bacterium]MBI3307763.1 F0F1 ATP synthase subunit gamma [Candidatus Melainabacteria bacterium]